MTVAHIICNECSYVIPASGSLHEKLVCERCGNDISSMDKKSSMQTVAFSLTALILYFPANFFPFMAMELYGNRSKANIWEGVVALYDAGSWFIALVVFVASIVLPFIKLIVLLYLAMPHKSIQTARFKTKMFRSLEAIGRWSMLDIFLLAVMVAIMKLGPWTHVEPGIGAVLFALVVIFTMFASSSFDPRLLWRNIDEEN